jgi:hypothetical protein
MTVVALIITMHCTAHASDSLIAVRQEDGTLKVKETQKTKLIPVRPWRGAMAYWGLAKLGPNMWTLDWLRQQASLAREQDPPEIFAELLAQKLTHAVNTLTRQSFVRPENTGLGIHFTAYERVRDYWIPELFQIQNWTDESTVLCARRASSSPVRPLVHFKMSRGHSIMDNPITGSPFIRLFTTACFSVLTMATQCSSIQSPTRSSTRSRNSCIARP